MKYQIKPLSLGGIFDEAIRLVRDELSLLFALVAFTVIPLQAVIGFFSMNLQKEGVTLENVWTTVLPVGILAIVVGFPLSVFTNAAVTYAVTCIYHSRPVTVAASFRHGLKRFLPLVGTTILMTLAIIVGMFLFLIPGIVFSFWFAFAQTVAVLENSAGSAALSRSRALMKGNIAALLVVSLISIVIVVSFTMFASLVPQIHIQVVASALCHGIATVFGIAVSVVFYFSCRCKLENYDLYVLATAIAEARPNDPESQIPVG